jgi:hypothetical protein
MAIVTYRAGSNPARIHSSAFMGRCSLGRWRDMHTIRLKVKAESNSWLNLAAAEVNQVWNWANETSYHAATRTDNKRAWLSGFDVAMTLRIIELR